MKKPPCFERHPCPDRSATCHGSCPDFREWNTQHEAELERIREIKRQEQRAREYAFARREKLHKRRHLK